MNWRNTILLQRTLREYAHMYIKLLCTRLLACFNQAFTTYNIVLRMVGGLNYFIYCVFFLQADLHCIQLFF